MNDENCRCAGPFIGFFKKISSELPFLRQLFNLFDRNLKRNIVIYRIGNVPAKGFGSAHGGRWKPKNEATERLLGEPGTIKTTTNDMAKTDNEVWFWKGKSSTEKLKSLEIRKYSRVF